MMKANQRGDFIVKIVIKVFIVGCQTWILIECIGTVIYSEIKYGHINPDVLYYPTKFV